MRRLRALGILLAVFWLAGATTVAVWPLVAHAPWEETRVVERVVTRGDTAVDEPAFSLADVLRLATTQSLGAVPRTWVRCREASYRSVNRMWVVTCGFYVNRDDAEPAVTRTYTFDDRTGRLSIAR